MPSKAGEAAKGRTPANRSVPVYTAPTAAGSQVVTVPVPRTPAKTISPVAPIPLMTEA